MCCRQKTDTVLYEKVQRATLRRQGSLDSRPAEGEDDEVYEPAGPSSSSHTHKRTLSPSSPCEPTWGRPQSLGH